MFTPTEEQLYVLSDAIADLVTIGDFTGYPVTPVSMASKELECYLPEMEPNRCYDNVFSLMEQLCLDKGYTGDEVMYVTGVAVGASSLPCPHAWLKLKGQYYDLSWQANLKGTRNFKTEHPTYTYHAMAELTLGMLAQATARNDYVPPCPCAILEYSPTMLKVST